MNYLDYLDDKIRRFEEKEQGIIYLYLRLYGYELHNNIDNNDTIVNFNKLMDSYESINSIKSNIQNIYNTHIRNKANNKMNEETKALYYLYDKFDKLKNDEECKSNECKCAEDCDNLYNRYKDSDSHGEAFRKELEKFKEQYDFYIKEKYICYENIIFLLFSKYPYISIILVPVLISFILFVLYKVINSFI
ncbi:hypothetical protein PVBG_04013 [Plasmodium vivax Brazil I]|uniref:Variable surface protein n=1 Tax=Plasmodium vivax (strain Brazil I) TaxID=1033975 RepID=A0A0J9VK25_PLAV1|nr:hypothetical protein PVBG_04013 [Plasmodium vivax Brazil I]